LKQQQTLAEKVSCTGFGLHTGAPVQLTLHPARANAGIQFVRRAGAHSVEIPARSAAVSSTLHATSLARDGVNVATVEHLLSALYALGIDNARIEVDGPEVPAMDGSAAHFVFLIGSAGILRQQMPRRVLSIRRALEVVDGERRVRVEPASELRVSYAVQFDHPAIGRQELVLPRIDREIFECELARARTFGFLEEVNELWRAGLARGGSLDNTVVLDHERVLNAGGLRWPDEFVRHKVVDLLGDLALLGLPIQGHVRVERGGHSLHQRLVRKILETADAWRILGDVADLATGSELARLSAAAG
jgi:UDP-3-O-[3-hydroxymyristoyl] N-acetylglucosamine deacetylase